MENLTEAAKRFKQSASEQRQATQQIAASEFERLNTAIAQESKNAERTLRSAFRGLSRQRWALGTLSAIPLIVVFLSGCALTAWLCLGQDYRVVKTTTLDGYRGEWTQCLVQPLSSKNGTAWCMVKDGKE